MGSIAARSNSISQRVMKPLEVGVFTAEESPTAQDLTTYQGTGNGCHLLPQLMLWLIPSIGAGPPVETTKGKSLAGTAGKETDEVTEATIIKVVPRCCPSR